MRAKPFLKWAGNKYRLVDAILARLPKGARLVEPFAGSAAVFLNAPFERALICDVNADLVGLFRCLKDRGENFIAFCASFFTPENNRAERYYELRERFNQSKDAAERAALLLYLNRHGFNGLVRYNASGRFNVPFGRYRLPRFPLEEMRVFCRKCRAAEVEFKAMDFRRVFAALEPGDVVYCDPPYVPLSATAAFTAYAGGGFGEKDQADLARLAALAGEKGIPVLLSNHDTGFTRDLYAAARVEGFSVRRFISCRAESRGPAPELLALYG